MFKSKLSNCNQAEIDSITNDFYAEITPIKNLELHLSEEINQLTLEMQSKMHSELSKLNLQELQNQFNSDKEKLTQFASDVLSRASATSPNIKPNQANINQFQVLISTVIREYSNNQKAEGKWTAKTEDTVNEIFGMWLRIVGDRPIIEYGFEQHREYRALLLKLPPNINKSPKFRSKSFDEILKLNEKPAASHTINKKLARVSSLFEWAIQHGYTSLNPAKGMTIRSPKLARDERQVFSNHDLIKLFSSEVFVEKNTDIHITIGCHYLLYAQVLG